MEHPIRPRVKPRPPLTPVPGRRLGRPGAALLACVLVVAVAAPIVLAAETIMISQRNRKFTPDALSIQRGSVLHIVNDDKVTHHVFIDGGGMSFDSGEQPIGASVDVPFDRTGTFAVQCAIHPTMRLQVTVK